MVLKMPLATLLEDCAKGIVSPLGLLSIGCEVNMDEYLIKRECQVI